MRNKGDIATISDGLKFWNWGGGEAGASYLEDSM